jgi:hypothetical protein
LLNPLELRLLVMLLPLFLLSITIWRFFPLKAQPVVAAPHVYFINPALKIVTKFGIPTQYPLPSQITVREAEASAG